MAAQAPRPRQGIGVNAAAGPSGRSGIHLPTAYDRFDNNKRNRWIDELQRKIRDGLNGPVSPGPSRSPSPLLDRQDGPGEQDVFADIGAAAEDGLQRDAGHTLEVQVNGYHEESEEEDEDEEDGLVGSGGLDEEYEDDQLLSDPLDPEDVLPDQEGFDGEYADEASQGEEEVEVDYEDELDDQENGEDEGDEGSGLEVPAQAQQVEFIGSSDEEDQADQDEEEERHDEEELEEEGYDEGSPPTMSENIQEDRQNPFPHLATDIREGASLGASSSSLYPTLPDQPMTIDPSRLSQSIVPSRDAAVSPISSSSDWPTTAGFGVPAEMIDPVLLQQLAEEADRASSGLYPDLPPTVSTGLYENDLVTAMSHGDVAGGEETDYAMREEEEEPTARHEFPPHPLLDEGEVLPSEEPEPVEEEEEEEEPVEEAEEEYNDGSGLQQAFGAQGGAIRRGPSHGPTPDDEVIEVLSSSEDEEASDEGDEDEQREPEYSEQEDEEEGAVPGRRENVDLLQEDQLEQDEDEEMDDQDLRQTQPAPQKLAADHDDPTGSSPVPEEEESASPAYEDYAGLPSVVQPDSSSFDDTTGISIPALAHDLGLPPGVQSEPGDPQAVELEFKSREGVESGLPSIVQSVPPRSYAPTSDLDPLLDNAPSFTPHQIDQDQLEDEEYESEATPEPVDPSYVAKAFGDDIAVDEDEEEPEEAGFGRQVITEDIEIEEVQDEDGSREFFSRTTVQQVFEPISQPVTPFESSPQMEWEELADNVDEAALGGQPPAADEEMNEPAAGAIGNAETVEGLGMDMDSTTIQAVSVAAESTLGSTDLQGESVTVASAEVDNGRDLVQEADELEENRNMAIEEAAASLPDPYVPPRDTSMPIPFLLRTPRTSPSPSASVIVAPSEAPPAISAVSEPEAPVPVEREETPVDMPDPHEPPPDTKMPSPQIPLQSVSRVTPSPSLIVEPPRNPPEPSSVDVRQEQREETPPELPDPSLPPPPLDADRFSPLEASDFMDTHYSPTGSLVAEPPDQTPLPSSAVFDPETNREETPTPLPDPQAAVPDTDLEPPLTPHHLKPSLITPSPSLVVEPPDETPWASKTGTVHEGSIDTPPAPRVDSLIGQAIPAVDNQAMEQDVKPSPARRSARLQSSSVEPVSTRQPVEPAGPSEPIATRLRHQHGPRAPAPPVAATRSRSFHFTPTPTPDPETASSPHLTRSQCFYRKLHLAEEDFDAVVLVPQCTVVDEKVLGEEEAENLGEPSVMEQAEGQMRPITANNPQLDDPLNSKLHRIVGAQIVNEGHCYLLSASESALLPPKEDDAETTPTLGTARGQGSARRGRRSSSKHDPISKHTPPPRASPLLAPRQTRASARKSGISVEPESLGRPSASPQLDHGARRSISQGSMSGSPGETLKRSLRRSASAAFGNADSPAKHTRSQGPAPVEDSPGESSESQPTPRAKDSPARHTRSHISQSATPTPESPPQKRTRGGRGTSTGVARAKGADSLGFIKGEAGDEVDELDSIPRADDIEIDVKVETTPVGKGKRGRRSAARTTDDAPYRPAEESEADSAGEMEVKSEEEEEVKPAKGKGRARKAKSESSVPPAEDEPEEAIETDAETDVVWEEPVPSPKVAKRKSRRSLAAMKDNAAFKYDPSATATPDESDPEMDDDDTPAPGRLHKGRKRKSRPSMMDREPSSLWKDTTAAEAEGEVTVGVETRSTKRRAVDDAKQPGSPVVATSKARLSSQTDGKAVIEAKGKAKKRWWPFGR